jgi:hypothetical protein
MVRGGSQPGISPARVAFLIGFVGFFVGLFLKTAMDAGK